MAFLSGVGVRIIAKVAAAAITADFESNREARLDLVGVVELFISDWKHPPCDEDSSNKC